MPVVETIGQIRREHFIQGESTKENARDLRLSRDTVRKVLRSKETSFSYERQMQPRPKLGGWKEELDGTTNAEATAREAADPGPPFEELRALGYEGGYDAVPLTQAAGRRRMRARRVGRHDDNREGRPCPSRPHDGLCAPIRARRRRSCSTRTSARSRSSGAPRLRP